MSGAIECCIDCMRKRAIEPGTPQYETALKAEAELAALREENERLVTALDTIAALPLDDVDGSVAERSAIRAIHIAANAVHAAKWGDMSDKVYVGEMLDTIAALREENERLKATSLTLEEWENIECWIAAKIRAAKGEA